MDLHQKCDGELRCNWANNREVISQLHPTVQASKPHCDNDKDKDGGQGQDHRKSTKEEKKLHNENF